MTRVEEGAAVCHQILQVQPDFTEAQLFLRINLLAEGRPAELSVLARGLVLVQPNNPEAHLVLRLALIRQGQLDEALTAARRALEVSPKSPILPVGVIELFVRESEQLVALAPRLPAYASGEQKPRHAHELALLILLCYTRQEYLTAARIYRHAFDADPRLVDDVTHERRYDAARFAARVAAGLADAARLPEPERAEWRKQALTWLQADLAGWRKLLADGSEEDRVLAWERLRWWQEDPKLAGLRDPAARAKLPSVDQPAWQDLWADVAALLAKDSP
jgi:tetratricopeptide (TPR) repeat protein